MTEAARERRRRLDHERYMRSREARLAYQREYYREHNERILWKKKLRSCGMVERKEESMTAAEKKRERDRLYYISHRDEILERARARQKAKKSKYVMFV